jgi:hypothetical protein
MEEGAEDRGWRVENRRAKMEGIEIGIEDRIIYRWRESPEGASERPRRLYGEPVRLATPEGGRPIRRFRRLPLILLLHMLSFSQSMAIETGEQFSYERPERPA